MIAFLLWPLLLQQRNVEDSADIERITHLLRTGALTYEMQDIAFTQELVSWRQKRNSEKWRFEDRSYTARLEHNGKVYWQWLRSADDDVTKHNRWKMATIGCKDDLFEELTRAPLRWTAWIDIRGRRSAAFEFSLGRKARECNLPDRRINNVSDIAGIIYVDASSGQIWRVVTNYIGEPPFDKLSTTTSDYDFVELGSSKQAVVIRRVETTYFADYTARLEWTFTHFRRFGASATIRFDSP